MTATTADEFARLSVISAAAHFCDHVAGVHLGAPPAKLLLGLEGHLARYVCDDWTLRGRAGARAAVSGGIVAVHNSMRSWRSDVQHRVSGDLRLAYALGRQSGAQKAVAAHRQRKGIVAKAPPPGDRRAAELLATFDTVDEAALASLEQQLFWVGDQYGEEVAHAVEAAAAEMLSRGAGSEEAARALRAHLEGVVGTVPVPPGFMGDTLLYLRGVVSAAVNAAHNYGQVASFFRAGESHYAWNTVEDERVCDRCGHMHGKKFAVSDAMRVMAQALAATTPAQLKAAQPWLNASQLRAISQEPGHVSDADSAALAAAGVCIPPLHQLCRCTLDVVLED